MANYNVSIELPINGCVPFGKESLESTRRFMDTLHIRDDVTSIADHLAAVAHFSRSLALCDAGMKVVGLALVTGGSPRTTRANIGVSMRDGMLTYSEKITLLIEG